MLAWMLEALHAVGVPRVVIVVGHCADQVEALTASAPRGLSIQCVHNPAYQKGSALSLYCARDVMVREPTLIMDADVVFPREFLRRLVGSAAANALLIDLGFADTGEEVKIYTQGDQVIALGKKVIPKAPARARDRREPGALRVRGRAASLGEPAPRAGRGRDGIAVDGGGLRRGPAPGPDGGLPGDCPALNFEPRRRPAFRVERRPGAGARRELS
jgi:MobA-like NTP transferase domain